MAKKYVSITIPDYLVEEPLIYRLGKRFKVIPSIYKARIRGDEGWMIIELEGDESEIDNSITYLKDKGFIVEAGGQEILDRIPGKKLRRIRVRLEFPDRNKKRPILYEISEKFGVVTSIRRADINEVSSWIELEINGDSLSIDEAIDYIKALNISIIPIEGDIVE